MDDGSRHGDGLHLSVYAFCEDSVDRLMYTLQEKFKFKCSIHYNRDKTPVFTFSKNLWMN